VLVRRRRHLLLEELKRHDPRLRETLAAAAGQDRALGGRC
jgi:hypothetical protein